MTIGTYALEGRSRKGAWIEMLLIACGRANPHGRSRKGAWIEINFILELASSV